VVIVNATRDDLRDELAMADEAFALSPISARAALPSEADYDAIREAFMETSRGRWFLGEYAKRNRNADTSMVLDAVARIEQTLAAQNKPDRDPALDEALAAIRAALDAARLAASAALGDLALAENLAPVRKGARVIREISWRLREIGADGRICDLIDSQVGVIEQASGKLAAIDPAAALDAAFGLIEGRIGAFDAAEADTAAEVVEEAFRSSPQVAEEVDASAAVAEQEVATAPAEPDEAANGMTEAIAAETVPTAGFAVLPVEPFEANLEAAAAAVAEPADALEEQDEAVLDLIAAEMAAPDSDEAYVPPGMKIEDDEALWSEAQSSAEAEQAAPAPTSARGISEAAPPLLEPSLEPSFEPSFERSLEPLLERSVEASPEPSLGSSLIASGIVQRPRGIRPDPLAPIRRMSQAEKIAFFS
jgi:hypothetical protein